jgi:hypothetical protein
LREVDLSEAVEADKTERQGQTTVAGHAVSGSAGSTTRMTKGSAISALTRMIAASGASKLAGGAAKHQKPAGAEDHRRHQQGQMIRQPLTGLPEGEYR